LVESAGIRVRLINDIRRRNGVGLARCPVLFYPQGLTGKLMEHLRHKSFNMLIVLEKIVDASLVALRKLLGGYPQLS
jgi:hypothetical protein